MGSDISIHMYSFYSVNTHRDDTFFIPLILEKCIVENIYECALTFTMSGKTERKDGGRKHSKVYISSLNYLK